MLAASAGRRREAATYPTMMQRSVKGGATLIDSDNPLNIDSDNPLNRTSMCWQLVPRATQRTPRSARVLHAHNPGRKP